MGGSGKEFFSLSAPLNSGEKAAGKRLFPKPISKPLGF
jgi:hypothetical protein